MVTQQVMKASQQAFTAIKKPTAKTGLAGQIQLRLQAAVAPEFGPAIGSVIQLGCGSDIIVM